MTAPEILTALATRADYSGQSLKSLRAKLARLNKKDSIAYPWSLVAACDQLKCTFSVPRELWNDFMRRYEADAIARAERYLSES